MASQDVQPLRITKSPASKTMASPGRALAELSPMGARRNSPSYALGKKTAANGDSSPFEVSPAPSSPHSFWKNRENAPPARMDTENAPRDGSISPTRRSSIEKLKQASRVNNNMFMRQKTDNDESSMLSTRPLSVNPSNRWGVELRPTAQRAPNSSDSQEKTSPPKQSPQKSSLSANSRYTPHDESFVTADETEQPRASPPRTLRAPKSVTFDDLPPQVNEYLSVTPDPSSVASGSREGSCESDVYDMDESFEHDVDREDSFDESLEDADKTPVVLPEDWRFMSPDAANTGLADTFEDPFTSRPQSVRYRGTPERNIGVARSNSLASNGEQRPLPPLPAGQSRHQTASPRPASTSKADVLGMRASPMPIEERLQMLSLQNEEAKRKADEAKKLASAALANEEMPVLDLKPPPRVSRESILRSVQIDDDEDDYFDADSTSRPTSRRDEIDYANLDPDVPIPSRETSSSYGATIDLYTQRQEEPLDERSVSPADFDFARETSIIHHDVPEDEEEEEEEPEPESEPRKVTSSQSEGRMSLPEFQPVFSPSDYGFGLQTYLTPPPAPQVIESKPVLRPNTAEEVASESDATIEEASDNDATPESVIHNPVETVPTSPAVAESAATIKAPGSKLKTRVSATPADLHAMASSRRQVSGDSQAGANPAPTQALGRRQSIRKLNIELGPIGEELGLNLSEEFDRLMDAQKVRRPRDHANRQKGYVMKENAKVVVANSRQPSAESKMSQTSQDTGDLPGDRVKASTREVKSANSSPSKPSATWSTEPWNGRIRRHSTRRTNTVINPERPMTHGPVPPMPGMESNASAIDAVDDILEEDESGERGRLFVKVVNVKELALPLPKSRSMSELANPDEPCQFQMTLDNGLHCVTTSWAELGKTSLIGQEFELVVFDDLEFQLTLQTRLERPNSASGLQSSNSSIAGAKKTSAWSRIFGSPKKRKEQERLEEEARMVQQQQLDPTAWDLQSHLVGEDGSFARAYIALSNHEEHAYGRPITVDIPAWNEWALDDKTGASTRSKLGGIQCRPPYVIAKMELQMMYVPRPRNVSEDDMPKSMSAAIRQLKDAESTVSRQFEGHLSQQGGDCPLNGSKLTAYHDFTRQPRATIALAKAERLIDDKTSLTKTDAAAQARGKRRKSAFAEDEEGYMFVEEGFRIRFTNGEVIDFYADSTQEKDEWMRVLADVVGREAPGERKTWMSAVLARERALAAPADAAAGTVAAKTDRPATQPKAGQPVFKDSAAKTAVVQESKLPRTGSQSARTSFSRPGVPVPARSAARSSLPVPASPVKDARAPPPLDKSPRHDRARSPAKGHAKSASTSAVRPASPGKRMLTGPQSPFKDGSSSSSSSSKRGSNTTLAIGTSPTKGVARAGAKELSNKRAGVRSMIF